MNVRQGKYINYCLVYHFFFKESYIFIVIRFHGVGTFSNMNGGYFENPCFIKGHWIVFNQDLFGFLWIIDGQNGDLSLYHRVKDLLVPSI